MRQENFTLKDIDDSTAEKLTEEYPANWDMTDIFEKSYKKFLDAKAGGNTDDAEDTLEFEEAEVIAPKKHIRVFTAGRVAAAACIAAEVLLLRAVYLMPQRSETPDNIDIIPVMTNITATDNTVEESTEVIVTAIVTEQVTVPTVTEPVPTAAAEDATVPEDAEEEENDSPDDTEETTEAPEAPEDETEEAQTGFVVNKGAYVGSGSTDGFDEVKYIPDHDVPDSIHDHSGDIDGYTLLNRSVKGGLIEMQLMDDNGGLYFVTVFPYETFKMGFDPDSGTEIEHTTVNGRPAIFRSDSEDENSFGYLIWDDGCHVCMIMTELKNYEGMTALAESFN